MDLFSQNRNHLSNNYATNNVKGDYPANIMVVGIT